MASIDHVGKGEEAFRSLGAALALTGINGGDAVTLAMLTGQEDEQKTIPRVVFSITDDGEEVVRNSGIFKNQGAIEIVSNLSDESKADHHARVKAIMDALQTDTLEADLKAAVTEYHVYDVLWRGPRHEVNGNATHTIYPFEIVHCCSALT